MFVALFVLFIRFRCLCLFFPPGHKSLLFFLIAAPQKSHERNKKRSNSNPKSIWYNFVLGCGCSRIAVVIIFNMQLAELIYHRVLFCFVFSCNQPVVNTDCLCAVQSMNGCVCV